MTLKTVVDRMLQKLNKMWLYTFIAAAFIAVASAEGELQILHSTGALHFHGHERLPSDTIKEVFSATLGFTVGKISEWKGLRILDPFQYSEGVVAIVVDGVSSLESDIPHIHRYPLTTNEHEEDTWLALQSRIIQRYPQKFHNNTLYRIDLQDVVAGKKCQLLDGVHIDQDTQQYEYLDINLEEDSELIKEVQVLRTIAHKIETLGELNDGLPDLYWIVLRGLHAVSDIHGPQSEVTREAKRLVSNAAEAVSRAFAAAYDERVVVATIATDSSHTRRTRSLLEEGEKSEPLDIASSISADGVSEDYPVIFNIMLWFGIAFVFTLIAISVSIADMDPGRDSIIYRMTSTRMKKDN